jgi:hypothetical protein
MLFPQEANLKTFMMSPDIPEDIMAVPNPTGMLTAGRPVGYSMTFDQVPARTPPHSNAPSRCRLQET